MRLATLMLATCGLLFLSAPALAQRRRAPEPAPQPAPEPSPQPAPPAADEPPAEYRAMVQQAIAEFDAGNFDEALALFEHAFELRPSARVLRGMGKVLFEQRRYVRSLEAFERALASEVDALTPTMRTEVEELRDRASRYVGTLSIHVTPSGATVLVDGREVDASAPLRVDLGVHLVEANAADHDPARRTVDVPGGETTTVELALVEQRASLVVVTRDDSAAIATGVAGIGLVGTTIGSLVWMTNRLDAVSRCETAERAGVRCVNRATVSGERDGAIAAMVVSSVLLAGAVTVFVLLVTQGGPAVEQPASAPTEARVLPDCAVSVDGASCGVTGSF